MPIGYSCTVPCAWHVLREGTEKRTRLAVILFLNSDSQETDVMKDLQSELVHKMQEFITRAPYDNGTLTLGLPSQTERKIRR